MAREGWARAKEVTDLNWDGLLALLSTLNSQDRCISGHTRSQLRGSSEGFGDRTGAQKVYYQSRCRACVFVITHTSSDDAPTAPECLSYDSAVTSGCFGGGQLTCDTNSHPIIPRARKGTVNTPYLISEGNLSIGKVKGAGTSKLPYPRSRS